jgi:hypothetical protein
MQVSVENHQPRTALGPVTPLSLYHYRFEMGARIPLHWCDGMSTNMSIKIVRAVVDTFILFLLYVSLFVDGRDIAFCLMDLHATHKDTFPKPPDEDVRLFHKLYHDVAQSFLNSEHGAY